MPFANIFKRKRNNEEDWSKRLFTDYNNARNNNILNSGSSELMVLKEVSEMDKSDVSFLLPSFINDVRKKAGSKYPAESLRQLICSLFHFFKYLFSLICITYLYQIARVQFGKEIKFCWLIYAYVHSSRLILPMNKTVLL